MKRILLITCALAGFVIGTAAGATSTASSTKRPSLKLIRPTPLTVSATAFKPAERVVVRVIGSDPAMRRVRASGRGSFVVTFAEVSMDRCSGVAFTAVGARGSRAVLKRPETYCPPPL